MEIYLIGREYNFATVYKMLFNSRSSKTIYIRVR